MTRYLNLYEDGQVGRSWPSRKLAEISRSRLVKCVALLVVRDNNGQFIVKRDRIAELLREPRTKMEPRGDRGTAAIVGSRRDGPGALSPDPYTALTLLGTYLP